MGGRIRSIKPELLVDEKTASLPSDSWRLFVSLLLLVDDYGNTHASPKRIRAAIFWAQDAVDFDTAMARVVADKLVRLYEIDGQQYLHVNGWSKHQRVDKPGKPHCPAPPADAIIPETVATDPPPVASPPDETKPAKEVPANIRESLAKVPGSLAPDLDLDLDQDQEDDRGEVAPTIPSDSWGVQNRVKERSLGRIDERVQGERERALIGIGSRFGWDRLVRDLDAICDCVADDAGLATLKAAASEGRQTFTLSLAAWLGRADTDGKFSGDALFALARQSHEWAAKRAARKPSFTAPDATPSLTAEQIRAMRPNFRGPDV